MRKVLLLLFSLMGICAWGQNSSKYNSMCIFKDSVHAESYICTAIDSITYTFSNDSTYQMLWSGDENIKVGVANIDSVIFYNPYVEGILEINQHIDFWDNTYVTPIGYFCYKSSLPYDSSEIDSEMYEMLSYVNFEKSTLLNAVFSKEHNLPVSLALDSLMLYFSYNNDSICSIIIESDSVTIGSLEFVYNDSVVCGVNEYSSCNLKRNLWKLVALLDGNTAEYKSLSDIIELFKTLLRTEDEKETSKAEIYPKVGGRYLYISFGYSQTYIVKNIYYTVIAMTGSSYDVKTQSAVLEGAIRCANSKYNEYGVYGIICDEDESKLSIEKAKYNVVGHQDKLSLSYKVQVSGLKPNKQYYYRAYYRIKGKCDLKYRYAKDIAANATYGKVKGFYTKAPSVTTGEALNITSNSATVKCSYKNVEGLNCGVIVSGNGKVECIKANSNDGEQEISLTGLKAVTNYSYCAYVIIDGDTIKGTNKEFTTSMPDISGTWSCVEKYYAYTGAPASYRTYSVTINKDGTVRYSESEAISSSWYLGNDGRVRIAIVTIATQTFTSGIDWEGKVDNLDNPQKITGYRTPWNANHIGYFGGDGYEFTMTR